MKSIPIVLAVLLGIALTAAAEEDAALKFVDAKVPDVLAYYGRVTGRKILCDNTVQGVISGVTDHAVSNEKAAELIEKALFLNGFSLVDVSDDTVAVLGLGRSVRNAGVPLYTKPEEIPKAERVFSYLFKLQHRNPLEIQSLLQQYIPPSNAVSFVADPRSQTFVVTGQTSMIRTVMRLVEALDVPPAPDKTPRENRPAPPKLLMPPPPISDAGGDQ